MYKLHINLFSLLFIFPILGCKKNYQESTIDTYDKSYINNFELVQDNSKSKISFKILSPKAIIDSINNDIEIYESSILIKNNNGQNVQINSGKSTLNNSMNVIQAYNKVNISFPDNKDFLIKTDSFDWDLNTSNINFPSHLDIYFKNTSVISSNGSYNFESGQLKINDTIFNRIIFKNGVEPLYKIRIIAEMAKWSKENNSLEYSSTGKQVETSIDFLGIKNIK